MATATKTAKKTEKTDQTEGKAEQTEDKKKGEQKPRRKAGVDYDKVSDKVLLGAYVSEARANPNATPEDVVNRLKNEHGIERPPPADIIANKARGLKLAHRKWRKGYTTKDGEVIPPKHGPMKGLPLPDLGGVAHGGGPKSRDYAGLADELGLDGE